MDYLVGAQTASDQDLVDHLNEAYRTHIHPACAERSEGPLNTVLAPNVVPGVQERSVGAVGLVGSVGSVGAVGAVGSVGSVGVGHVAKISMLRLNIGSGKLSSCMLSIGLGPKCEQGKGGQPPLALNGFWSSANAEHV